jgi:photosystem II stability/assembly factor-like uncharacterized protein
MSRPSSSATPGSIGQAWPAYLVVLLVFGAAVYSFAHRPLPPFPPTQIQADKLLVNGLARNGTRYVAAGELGHILIADSPDGPWREAKVAPERGSTFTRVAFIGENIALAVGHDGWILRSTDNGETWREVAFDDQRPDALISLAGPFDGKLFAFGAFGLYTTSSDGGQTWQVAPLEIVDDKKKVEPKPAVDPDADPFANFSEQSDSAADRHLNAMARLADGTLLLVGERGLVLRSADQGATWQPIDSGYQGSFYGVLPLADSKVLVFGMRGNAFVTADLGKTWQKAEVPVQVSLFSGTVLEDGQIVLVGDNNSVLVSKDRGATFMVASEAKIRGLAAGLAEVVAIPGGKLLLAGDIGVKVQALAGETP